MTPPAWYNARRAYVLLGIFPGATRGWIKRFLGLSSWGAVESLLLAMDQYGFYTYEDDGGRLFRCGVGRVR